MASPVSRRFVVSDLSVAAPLSARERVGFFTVLVLSATAFAFCAGFFWSKHTAAFDNPATRVEVAFDSTRIPYTYLMIRGLSCSTGIGCSSQDVSPKPPAAWLARILPRISP